MEAASGNEKNYESLYRELAGDIDGLNHKDNVAVRWFVRAMREKLRKNAHKGGWRQDHPLVLLARLIEESGELAALLGQHPDEWDFQKITEEAADVANFAMMIQDAAKSMGN